MEENLLSQFYDCFDSIRKFSLRNAEETTLPEWCSEEDKSEFEQQILEYKKDIELPIEKYMERFTWCIIPGIPAIELNKEVYCLEVAKILKENPSLSLELRCEENGRIATYDIFVRYSDDCLYGEIEQHPHPGFEWVYGGFDI